MPDGAMHEAAVRSDPAAIAEFAGAMFRHADPAGFVAARSFYDDEKNGLPFQVLAVAVREAKPFAPRLVGTNDGLDRARTEVLRGALVETILPRASGECKAASPSEPARCAGPFRRLRIRLLRGNLLRRIGRLLEKAEGGRGRGQEAELASGAGHLLACSAPARSLAKRPRRIRSAISVRSYSATAPRICRSRRSCGSSLIGRSRNSAAQPARAHSSRRTIWCT